MDPPGPCDKLSIDGNVDGSENHLLKIPRYDEEYVLEQITDDEDEKSD
jgi:hypothetical protein